MAMATGAGKDGNKYEWQSWPTRSLEGMPPKHRRLAAWFSEPDGTDGMADNQRAGSFDFTPHVMTELAKTGISPGGFRTTTRSGPSSGWTERRAGQRLF